MPYHATARLSERNYFIHQLWNKGFSIPRIAEILNDGTTPKHVSNVLRNIKDSGRIVLPHQPRPTLGSQYL